MSVETTIIPHSRFPDLLDYPWAADTSLYTVFEEKYQVIPKTADQTIRSVTATHHHCTLLEVEPKSPLLMVETVTYDQHGLPIEFGQFYYRADRYEYQVRLKRE
jgi:GntR family transcriptional regulator